MTEHRCDERCVCPVDGEPLLYSRMLDEHACAHPECVNAHGMDGVLTALFEDIFHPRAWGSPPRD